MSARAVPPLQAELVGRLRDLLAHEPSTREVAMFGGRAFMVEDRMVVSAGRDGDLLVRVRADRGAELAARPGAARAEMSGRRMGPGWLRIEPSAIAGDDALGEWLAIALDHLRSSG